ncbi:low molecular weight phosphatase family protein [Arthrobacter sp. I2-34]|uniref:Low molecular weight phosphatase family protein n=1 Tax=Arthrobacter hankyongi TaxID=2904801 RepID=A0ABS9L5G2_9MICC|nr:low molecular weight phosphatase family protein [Arthrobacter hankyongi]MCG2621911.1 low molecular weight phosphatase family protein [Arthrobacter hankyongi]
MNFKADQPSVLFVCSSNSGKSPMAAGLMEQVAAGTVRVRSCGTAPAGSVNPESAASLAELGIDIGDTVPTAVTDEAQRAADVVVILGSNAQLEPLPGTRYERWEIDEPSLRGIHGAERMRLVRDEIKARVEALHRELTQR